MSPPAEPKLVRAIGRWTLAALVLNAILGSGIFGLPKDVAKYLGHDAPWAYLLAAAGIGLIMACLAEVASQFPQTGGLYLYAREAFGRFAGIQMGWLAWLVRLTSTAANANLFVIYLSHFWPEASQPGPRAAVLTLLLALPAAANVRGVNTGAKLNNLMITAKLIPIALFIASGFLLLRGPLPAEAPAGSGEWLAAMLALMFAFGGFEAAVTPMGEARDPRRDAPFALFVGLVTCAAIYTLVHLVVMRALADPSATDRPLAAAAQVFLGGAGATLISLGALLSTFGWLSGAMVSVPRLTFALAEGRDFPPFFAAVHSKFRTPHVSIVIYAVLAWALALYGSFLWNAILSAVARLFTYGLVCGALIVLRRKKTGADAFRLPGGEMIAMLGMAFCAVLIAQMNRQHLIIMFFVAIVALGNWLWARRDGNQMHPG
jgi:APA family basic amino acid/polyamine antiporter